MRIPVIVVPFVSLLSFCSIRGPAQAAPTVRSMYPANGSNNSCIDTPLRITFSGNVTLGPTGKIELFDAANDQPVETIDVAAVAPPRGQGMGRAPSTSATQPTS